MSSLPQLDPYKTLGVRKDADLSTIRSAHRKLVLKCHPDKIQDAAMKAIKQDEFQQVQQAYELLSDETKRSQYDEQVKLSEWRKETGRGGPPTGNNVFDYEIRTAEPRSTTFRSAPREPTKVYTQSPPRSYEDDVRSSSFDEPLKARARKTASYEERKRPSTRDGEKHRRSEEEREQERWEKEARRAAHGTAKKNRDKERKKGSEEKFSRAYVEDDDSEDAYRPRTERRSHREMEEEIRQREKLARFAEKARKEEEITERTKKLDAHTDFAAQYVKASRRKAEPGADFKPKPMRRAETFQEQSYTIRHASPPSPFLDDEDLPRRSAARATPRRASEQLPIRSREQPRSSGKERRPSSYECDAYIVEASPQSPTMPAMWPPLQSHSSAPPVVPSMGTSRKEPHRSKTMQPEFVRRESTTAPPPLPRASTFQGVEKNKSSSKGSKLKTQMQYATDNSDSDSPALHYSPRPITPPRFRVAERTHYIIEGGRPIPVSRHRETFRDVDYGDRRERSVSPRGGRRSAARPPLMRSGGSGSHQPFSRAQYFSGSASPEPVINDVRPKTATRESGSSSRSPFFGEVKFAPSYGPEHVSYSDSYRRGSDPTHHRDYAYPPRPGREAAYG